MDAELSGIVLRMSVSGEEIDAWARWLRAAGRPESTIGLRTYHVRRVMAAIDTSPWELTAEQLVDYLADQAWAAETRRSYRASLRAFYAWGQATGRRVDSPAHLVPPIRVPRAKPRPTPEVLFREAIALADDRARLGIQLAGICGLRRGEIARTRREDLERDLVGWSLRVVGKGGHVRLVPVPDEVARVILRRQLGWLFPSPRGGHLTPGHVGKVIAGWFPAGFTTHNLRHRCGTIAYQQGGRDLRAVQELLGHAKPETTARYTLVASEAVRLAVRAAS